MPAVAQLPDAACSQRLRFYGFILLAFYILAGIVYSFSVPSVARFQDEKEYFALSENLLHGPGYSLDGEHLTAIRPPGYPFYLAGIESLGGGVIATRISHFFLIAATILLLCRFCAQDRWSGLFVPIITVLVALYPVLFFTGGTLYSQTLAEFLFIASIVLITGKDRGLWPELAGGLTFGALILTVPTFGLTLLVVVATAWFLQIIRWRGALAILFGASVVVGSWTTRNMVQFHELIPIASNSGTNFLLGNNENTIPYGGIGNIDLGHYKAEAEKLGLDEFGTDLYFRQSAMKWIETHPQQALTLYLEKVLNFFNVWNKYAKATDAQISPAKQVVMALTYILIVGLLAWRLAEIKQFPLEVREKFCLIVYVLSAFTTAVFITRIRFRLPFDYLLIAVIAMHLNRRLQGWLTSCKTASKK